MYHKKALTGLFVYLFHLYIMTKSNSSFKLSKTAKRELATVDNPHLRGNICRLFVAAEMAQQSAKTRRVRVEDREPAAG